MGRGRAKAKQTKVARRLKYNAPHTDLDALRQELASGQSGLPATDDAHDDHHDREDDEYGDYDKYADYDYGEWDDIAGEDDDTSQPPRDDRTGPVREDDSTRE